MALYSIYTGTLKVFRWVDQFFGKFFGLRIEHAGGAGRDFVKAAGEIFEASVGNLRFAHVEIAERLQLRKML
jgi:hypothetical protein